MSMPKFPDADFSMTREQAITLLLASIAYEELGLSHLINSEAEKIQYMLGTLEHQKMCPHVTTEDLLEINKSVGSMLKNIIKTEILLQFKMEEALSLKPSKPDCKCKWCC